jgi:hypothetical protein
LEPIHLGRANGPEILDRRANIGTP